MALEGTSFRRSILQGFLWLGTGTFIGQCISWISTVIIIRLLSPSDYGLMAMTGGFIALLTMVSELGVSAALIQARELTEREIRQIFSWVLITGLIGLAGCYASAPLVAQFYRVPDLVVMVQVLACNLLLLTAYVIPQSLFMREMNFKIKAQADISAQVGSTLLTLILAFNGFGVWALISGQMILHVIKAIVLNMARPHWIVPLFNLKGSSRLLRYGLTVTGDRMLNFVYEESDAIIIGRFLGDASLGGYAVAKTLASIPMEKVLPIITQVTFTSYSRVQDDLERIRKNILRTSRAIGFVGVPVFWGMSAVAPLGLPLILGPKWESLVLPFQLLCLILPLKAMSPILSPAVFAINRPTVNVVNVMIRAITMTLAFLVGVQAGVLGVCIAWVIAYPVVFSVTAIRSLRVLGLSFGEYLSTMRIPCITGALMLISVELFGRVVVTVQPVYSLILQTVVGVVVYVTLTVMFNKGQYAEIRDMFRH
jgi:O-antigen/teichoic acid export membrane protein